MGHGGHIRRRTGPRAENIYYLSWERKSLLSLPQGGGGGEPAGGMKSLERSHNSSRGLTWHPASIPAPRHAFG